MCRRPLNFIVRVPSLSRGRWQDANTALIRSARVEKLLYRRVRIVGHTAATLHTKHPGQRNRQCALRPKYIELRNEQAQVLLVVMGTHTVEGLRKQAQALCGFTAECTCSENMC